MRNPPHTGSPTAGRRLWAVFPLGVFVIYAAGCDQPEPTTYTIPNEDRSAETSAPPAPSTPKAGPAEQSGGGDGMRVLPGMEQAAEAAGAIRYETPDAWEEFPAEGIRKANFRATGPDGGTAEITVLAFPGDVGGMLANINRWRRQVGLPPAEADNADAISEPVSVSRHPARLVRIEGESASILGALLPFHGFTWFFKMQGDAGAVAANEDPFREFLASVSLEDDAH